MSKKKRKFGFAKSSLKVKSTAELEKEVQEMLNVPDPPVFSGVPIEGQHPHTICGMPYKDCVKDNKKNENPRWPKRNRSR